jgi:hypothetical protein
LQLDRWKKIFNKKKSKRKSTGSGRRSAFSGLKILNTDLVITFYSEIPVQGFFGGGGGGINVNRKQKTPPP